MTFSATAATESVQYRCIQWYETIGSAIGGNMQHWGGLGDQYPHKMGALSTCQPLVDILGSVATHSPPSPIFLMTVNRMGCTEAVANGEWLLEVHC